MTEATTRPGTPAGVRRYSAERLERFVEAVYLAHGLTPEDAHIGAIKTIEADRRGIDTHGIFRLPHFCRRIRTGGINKRPNIRVVQETAATAVVDGDNGLGYAVMARATEVAIEKARTAGVAWVGARHSNHAGAGALYAMMPLQYDMVGIYFAVASANHLPPWGAVSLLLGTNPIAFAIPAGEEPPIVLDMATTVASYGKVKVAAQRGEQMPEGWMVDRSGRPITDPKRSSEGFLLPIGGYKGYGLALVLGLLAGPLNGAAFGRDVVDFNADDLATTNTGHSIVAVDVAAFGPVDEFKREIDRHIRDLRQAERLPGVDRIWLPGEQSHAKMLDREAHGIPLNPVLLTQLQELARQCGLSDVLE